MFSQPKPCMSSMAFLYAMLFTLTFFSPPFASGEVTVYEILQDYGFPSALLPRGITDYELNVVEGTEVLTVYLNSTCTFDCDNYELQFDSIVKCGRSESGNLKNITGVRVRQFPLWGDITEVDKEGVKLTFTVGKSKINKSFPVSEFTESPTCGLTARGCTAEL